MNPVRTRGTAAAVLALALALGGCGSEGGGGKRTTDTTSAPAATGTGPHPVPPAPTEAAPLPTGPKATPEGGVARPGGVDRADADAVGKGALTVMWTFDTAVDRGPHDAGVRAADADWLTGEYARNLRAHRPRSAPGAQWAQWAGHRAYTTVALRSTEDAAKPADTGTEAWRQWTVTATPHGRDRWTGEPATVVAFVHLTRAAAGEPWRVADVAVQ